MNNPTPFMVARSAFHAARTPESAKHYADAALAAGFERNTLAAIANELSHAGYGDEAGRLA